MGDAIERIEPGTESWDAYLGNHLSRYQFASRTLADRRVSGRILDAATGVGYGANHLAETLGVQVVAVDRNAHAIRTARERFAHPRVEFLADDCHTLEKAAGRGPFDAIVSFETLEHLPRPLDFLRSCRRVLAPGGCMIISTPNARVTSPDRAVKWEFHEREYTMAEFVELLAEGGFAAPSLFGQRYTPMGRMREDLRAELRVLRANPFFRLGRLLQERLRGRHFAPPLPERTDEFELVPVSTEADTQGAEVPFVLVAVVSAGPA